MMNNKTRLATPLPLYMETPRGMTQPQSSGSHHKELDLGKLQIKTLHGPEPTSEDQTALSLTPIKLHHGYGFQTVTLSHMRQVSSRL